MSKKLDIDAHEAKVIIGLAQKIIQAIEDANNDGVKKVIRNSEDQHDLTDFRGYEKCEECND